MKKLGGQLFNELKKKATHIVYGFKLVRADGVVYGFTSSDQEFDYDGLTYKPINGFMGTAAASKQNLSVDNMSVTSMITTDVPEADLRSGRFDNAMVQIFWICPDHPEYGIVPIRGGRFGELTVKNAEFEVELRSIAWFLQQPFGKYYTLECSATLGDDECKVNLNPPVWQPNTGYVARAGADAGVGSWVKPSRPNGFWYWCVSARAKPSTVGPNGAWTASQGGNPWDGQPVALGIARSGQGGGAVPIAAVAAAPADGPTGTSIYQSNVDVTGQMVDSSAYLTPTKQYAAPASAPYGLQPLTITTHSMRLVLAQGASGGAEPAWPTTSGATVADNELVWKAYPARVRDGEVTAVFNKGEFEDANSTAPVHFFRYGLIEWLTGRNAGFKMEVRDFLLDPRPAFHLLEQMHFKIMPGDKYRATIGCPKTRPACKNTFENINNMRAMPDMPTEDRALQTPNFNQQGTQADTTQGGGS